MEKPIRDLRAADEVAAQGGQIRHGIAAGADIFVRQPWLGMLWACLAGAGILLFGVSKIMDFDELHGFPGAWRTMAFGIVSVVLGAGLVAVGFVLGSV